MKIHVGCGKRNFGPEWVHIDGESFPHVVDSDVTLKCYWHEDADVIYASHLLEYFDRDDAFDLLFSWKQVLKPGGLLRLAVPDFDALILAYSTSSPSSPSSLRSILGPLYGRMQMDGKTIHHRTVYNYIDLKDLLLQVGFKDVYKYDWQKTEHAHIDDHSQAYLPHMDKENGLLISLNVEAVK